MPDTNNSPANAIADLVEGLSSSLANIPQFEEKRSEGSPERREPRSWGFDVEEINQTYAMAIWGGKAVVLCEQPDAPFYDVFRVLSIDAFNKWYANRLTEIAGQDGKPNVVNWARAWMTHRDRRQYKGVEFFPNPDKAKSTPEYCNLWRGFGVSPSPSGDYGKFRDHLLTNVCRGDDKLFKYVFGWMAHIVQKPRERLGTALVLRGKMGTGKSKVGEVLGSLFPFHYFPVDDAQYVTGQFNDHMAACLLLQADEAVWAGDKGAEGRLKGMITSETQMINGKNVGAIRLKNYMRVIMTSNEDWVIPAGMDERRFCVLDVGESSMQNNEYFSELDAQLNAGGRERLLFDLLNLDLTQIDLWKIPKTRALLDQKLRSLDSVDAFWYNRLWDGSIIGGDTNWRARVTAAELYSEYVKASTQVGNGRRRSPAEFGTRLHKLVRDLRKVRASVAISPGVVERPWVYEFPMLEDCRNCFERLLGQDVEWPCPIEGEEEPAQKERWQDDVPV